MSTDLSSPSFFTRASAYADEYRKTITALSSGSLAVFFLALTAKVEPSLTRFQKGASIVALIMMSLSTLSVIISLFVSGKWAYVKASLEDNTPRSETDTQALRNEKARWHRMKESSDLWMALFFLIGVFAASLYVLSRVFNN